MKTTKHFEVVDVTKFMWHDTEEKFELHVKELIKNGKCKSKSGTNKVLRKKLEK